MKDAYIFHVETMNWLDILKIRRIDLINEKNRRKRVYIKLETNKWRRR